MTMNNPQQINKAKYYVDTRNQWCEECKERLTDGDMPDAIAPQLNCTECEAFAAGTHPEQHGKGKCQPTFTKEEEEWILKAIQIAWEETSSYIEDGDLRVDHAGEVEEVCDLNTNRWNALADICSRLGDKEQTHQCLELARKFQEAKTNDTTK